MNNSLACEFSKGHTCFLGYCKFLVLRARCLEVPLYLMTSELVGLFILSTLWHNTETTKQIEPCF